MMALVRGVTAARSRSGSMRKVGRVQGHENGFRPGQDRVRTVVLVKGLKDQHLVPGSNQRHKDRRHRLGGPTGDGDLSGVVQLQPVLRSVAFYQSRPQ